MKVSLGGTARSPEDVEKLGNLGLQFAEIPITDPQKIKKSDMDAYRSLGKDLGLFYLCHGPLEGDPNNTTNLEQVYYPKLVTILSIMPELKMEVLTIHLWLDPRFVGKEVIKYKIGLLRRIIDKAKQQGVDLCIENLSEDAGHMIDAFKDLPDLNLTLDLGHAQLLSDENTSLGFIEMFPERIRHIHLHDNRGGDSHEDDLHLPVGEGIIDFKTIFQGLEQIGYDKTITLELRPNEINQCLGYVRDLLNLSQTLK